MGFKCTLVQPAFWRISFQLHFGYSFPAHSFVHSPFLIKMSRSVWKWLGRNATGLTALCHATFVFSSNALKLGRRLSLEWMGLNFQTWGAFGVEQQTLASLRNEGDYNYCFVSTLCIASGNLSVFGFHYHNYEGIVAITDMHNKCHLRTCFYCKTN